VKTKKRAWYPKGNFFRIRKTQGRGKGFLWGKITINLGSSCSFKKPNPCTRTSLKTTPVLFKSPFPTKNYTGSTKLKNSPKTRPFIPKISPLKAREKIKLQKHYTQTKNHRKIASQTEGKDQNNKK
jgi:hypothetical protein